MNISPEKRIAGVLAPLFALRTENDLGIGDLDALRQLIDWAAGVGFKLVQLLPINEVGRDNSPYNAISARAIEPTTLYLAPGSPEDLSKEDYEAIVSQPDVRRLRRGYVKYDRVRQLKNDLLEKAFLRFQERNAASGIEPVRFEEFRAAEKEWLDGYTLFRALMEENGGSETWDQWLPEHRSPDTAHAWLAEQSAEKQAAFAGRQNFFRYVQWIAHTQWSEVKSYAEQRGVGLMGDIPFGISYYSADVFAQPDEFALEWSAGAPPEPYFKDDKFTQKWGQNWGIPLYRWDIMRLRNFAWWRERVRGVRQIFHLFRIDHVLGFYRIYAFPWRPSRNKEFLPLSWDEMLKRTNGATPHFAPRDDSNWENCEANRREGEEYLRVVLEESGTTRMIGEDLGTVPDYVRPHLRLLGIAGFKIPQWETDHTRVIQGGEYQRLSVATYATHDHKPVRALWEEAFEKQCATSEQSKEDLGKIAQFAKFSPLGPPDFEEFYPAIMEALFQSESWIVIPMITDLFGLRDRFNVPGTAKQSNWARRLQFTIPQLSSNPALKARMDVIRGLLEKTGRI